MEHGDLDNRLPPRWLVVFEGVIGRHLTSLDQKGFDFYRKARVWKRAVNTFQADEHTVKVLWDLTWRQNYKFDVVTFLPGGLPTQVRAWIDRHNIPAANVWEYESPAVLGRALAYMPDVYAVVHAEPSNRFTYGDRGMLVTDKWRI